MADASWEDILRHLWSGSTPGVTTKERVPRLCLVHQDQVGKNLKMFEMLSAAALRRKKNNSNKTSQISWLSDKKNT